jgi:hypothetical protein
MEIICRSNVFIDGVNVVDNDGSAQSNNAQRCGIITLAAGLHNIYIEGWAQSSALSMSATYRGPDTSGQELTIQAVTSPRAPLFAPPVFSECSTAGISGGFEICAFKARSDIDFRRVDDLDAFYLQVCKRKG